MTSRNRQTLLLMAGLVACAAISAQGAALYGKVGAEYPPAGQLAGDQVYPSVAISAQAGWIAWQSNASDGDGTGISARKLSSGYVGTGNVLQINQKTQGNQENASVTMLSDGGAVIIWQGGEAGGQDIYARFLRPDGLFAGNEVLLNTYTYAEQKTPEVAVLNNGQIIVVWSSYGQDGSMEGIYGQRLTSAGAKSGAEFRINETTAYNQRSPSISPLDTGGFVVTWISEQNRFEGSVDVFARTFNAAANPVGGEMMINTSSNICAAPAVRGVPGGGFVTSWAERNLSNLQNHWQIVARTYSGGAGAAVRQISVNSTGDRYAPRIAAGRDTLMVVWTSNGQDGSREGVFGRFLTSLGEPAGTEFQVNTYTESMQIHPALASDGANQFLAIWSSFVGGSTTFDLLAQRFGPAPSAPILRVSSIGKTRQLQWSTEPGIAYQVLMTTDLHAGFSELGPVRVATGTNDTLQVDLSAGAIFYQIRVVP